MAARERLLLGNVLVVALCALVYELLCGTLASYLLGDAVLQFSLVLGTYLSAMGVGAWAARSLEPRAATRYVEIELALAVVGGLSVPALLWGVAAKVPLRLALHGYVFVIGALVGIELPLLVRILRDRNGASREDDAADAGRFGRIVARALAYDYLGALAASLLFPLLLVPRLGLVRTAVLAGMVNALVALSATFVLTTSRPLLLRAASGVVLAVLLVVFARGEAWLAFATD